MAEKDLDVLSAPILGGGLKRNLKEHHHFGEGFFKNRDTHNMSFAHPVTAFFDHVAVA